MNHKLPLILIFAFILIQPITAATIEEDYDVNGCPDAIVLDLTHESDYDTTDSDTGEIVQDEFSNVQEHYEKAAIYDNREHGDMPDTVYTYDDPEEAECYYAGKSTETDINPENADAEYFECYTDSEGNMRVDQFDDPAEGSSDDLLIEAQVACYEKMGTDSQGTSPQPMAMYFVPKNGIPLGTKYSKVDGSVGEGGFDEHKVQSLHEAEGKYSGDDDKHSETTWLLKGMTQSSVYSEEGEYEKTWIVRNPGDSLKVSGTEIDNSNSVEDPEVFSGGFAGKCPAIWTRKEGEWRCNGGIQDTGTADLKVDFFNIKTNDGSTMEQKHAGFVIESESLNTWTDAYPNADIGGNTPGIGPLQVRSVCTAGDNLNLNNEHSRTITDVSNFEISGGFYNDVVVSTKLPSRSEIVDPGDLSRYKCFFGFQQTVKPGQMEEAPKKLLDLKHNEQGTLNYGAWDQDLTQISELPNKMYITEGLNNPGPTTVNEFRTAGEIDPLNLNSQFGYSVDTGQEFLSQIEGKTQRVGTDTEVFQQFPNREESAFDVEARTPINLE